MTNNNNDRTYIYLKVPEFYNCIYTKLLIKLSDIGISILNDCSYICNNKNKIIINCWYMFQSACAAYELGETKKANVLINYINKSLQFDCDINKDEPINPDQKPEITKEIIIGHYTGDPLIFKDLEYDNIISDSSTVNKEIKGYNQNKLTLNQLSDIHFVIIPDDVTLNKAQFGTVLITTLWDNSTKDGAYRVMTRNNENKNYTIYWFYSPIGAFEDEIALYCTINK